MKVKCIKDVVHETRGTICFVKGNTYSRIPSSDFDFTVIDEADNEHIISTLEFAKAFEEDPWFEEHFQLVKEMVEN